MSFLAHLSSSELFWSPVVRRLSVRPFLRLSVRLSVLLSVRLSVRPSVRLYVCLSVCLSVCKSVPISTKLGTKHPCVKGIQVCSNEEPRPFPRGDNCEVAKIDWQNLKIFFSRTTWPFSTKLVTMHPWVKGIQVCLNEGPNPFRRGDYYKNSKNTLTKLKKSLFQNHWANFNQFWHRASLGEDSNEKTISYHKVNIFFLLLINVMI